ncbi:MAG: hypothetical protein CL760_11970 [Chloroflexi bacterium]|nr:hypothetical protein [Chloroflexota bacterium]|tara:strand:- start:39539 stop:42802 length:3264 start_codon:yes stop_codon:yes gene_type:complete
MKGLLRKGILILAACSGLLTSGVAFSAEEEACLEPARFVERIGGGYEKGMEYKKSCSGFLKKHDPLFMTATQYLVTREQLLEESEFLTKLGFDVEYNVDNYEDYLEIPEIMSNIRDIIIWFSIFLLPTLSLIVLKQEKSKLSVMVLGLTIGAVFTVLQVASNPLKPAAYLVSNLNLYGWNSNEVERGLEYLTIGNVDQFGKEFEDQDELLSESVMANAINERITSLSLLKQGYGSNQSVEIDMGLDEGSPTVGEWLEYFRHCTKANHVEVESTNEWNFSLSSTPITSATIPESINFVRTGQPKKYDCDPDIYGYEKPFMTINSSIKDIIINFHQGRFEKSITSEAGFVDDVTTLFSESVGRANEEIEAANTLALGLSKEIKGDLDLLYAAIVAADSANQPVSESSGYNDFLNRKIETLKPLFQFDQAGVDAMDVSERTHLNAIKLAELKRGVIAGFSDEDRVVISEAKYGYDYMKEFLDEIIVNEFDYLCAVEDGDNYEFRVEHAKAWNAMDKTKLNKNASIADGTKGISGDHPIHCFSGYYEGNGLTIQALGDPQRIDEIKTKGQQKLRALKLYFRSLSEAAFNITMNDPSAYEQLRLDYLNSLDVDIKTSIDSRYSFLDQKEKMRNIFASVKGAFSVSFAESDELNYSEANKFFFYGQFTKENVDQDYKDKEDDSRMLRSYDFTQVLSTPKGGKKPSESQTVSPDVLDELGLDSSLLSYNEAFVYECPVIIEGKCMASISELNHVNRIGVQNNFMALFGGKMFLSGMSKLCSLSDKAIDGATNTVGGDSAGKSALKLGVKGVTIMKTLGCGAIKVIDSTIGWAMLFMMSLMALSWFFMMLMESMPILVMLFLYFHVFINFILPVLLLPILIFLDLAHGMVRYAMTGFEDEKSIIEMERTWSALKGIFFKTISLFITLTVMLYLYTSPSVGYLIDTLMNTLFTGLSAGNIIFWLFSGLIKNAAIVFTGLKVYRVCEVVENQIMQSFNVKTEGSLFNESNAIIGILSGMFTAKLHGEVKGFNKMAYGVSGKAGALGADAINKAIDMRKAKKKGSNPDNGQNEPESQESSEENKDSEKEPKAKQNESQ